MSEIVKSTRTPHLSLSLRKETSESTGASNPSCRHTRTHNRIHQQFAISAARGLARGQRSIQVLLLLGNSASEDRYSGSLPCNTVPMSRCSRVSGSLGAAIGDVIASAYLSAVFGAVEASFWKRGSFRSGSNIGSSRSSAGVSGMFGARRPPP